MDYLHLHWSDVDIHVKTVLASIFKYILGKPNFGTVFCLSLKSVMLSEAFLENLSAALELSISEKISVGLVLSNSDILEARKCGKFVVKGVIIFELISCIRLG